jgi:hypothetical protein
VGAVVYLTVYSLLPQGVAGDKLFFQMLGCMALIVAFLNAFTLKEVVGSHAEHGVPLPAGVTVEQGDSLWGRYAIAPVVSALGNDRRVSGPSIH